MCIVRACLGCLNHQTRERNDWGHCKPDARFWPRCCMLHKFETNADLNSMFNSMVDYPSFLNTRIRICIGNSVQWNSELAKKSPMQQVEMVVEYPLVDFI